MDEEDDERHEDTQQEHDHTMTSKKTMNSKRSTVAEAVPIVFAQRKKDATRMCGCGRRPSKQTPRPWWRDAAGMQTTGGDDAYDITHNASWIDTAGGATHRCEAKATAATEGRRGGMRRRGRDQMIVRRSVGRDRAARRQRSVC
jgi:hypothetical protein